MVSTRSGDHPLSSYTSPNFRKIYCNCLLPSHPCFAQYQRSVLIKQKKKSQCPCAARNLWPLNFQSCHVILRLAIKINECPSCTTRSVRSSSADRRPSDLRPSTRKGARIFLQWWGGVLQQRCPFLWLFCAVRGSG